VLWLVEQRNARQIGRHELSAESRERVILPAAPPPPAVAANLPPAWAAPHARGEPCAGRMYPLDGALAKALASTPNMLDRGSC